MTLFVDNRLLNICVKGFYLGLEIGPEAEAKTLEAEARTLEAEAEARTLEAEAEAGHFGLEAEAKLRGLTSLMIRNFDELYLGNGSISEKKGKHQVIEDMQAYATKNKFIGLLVFVLLESYHLISSIVLQSVFWLI